MSILCRLIGHKPDAYEFIRFESKLDKKLYYENGRWKCLRCGHENKWKSMYGRWVRLASYAGDLATMIRPAREMRMTDMRIKKRQVEADFVVVPENPVEYITLRFEKSDAERG